MKVGWQASVGVFSLAVLALGYPVVDLVRQNPVLREYYGMTGTMFWSMVGIVTLGPALMHLVAFRAGSGTWRIWTVVWLELLAVTLLLQATTTMGTLGRAVAVAVSGFWAFFFVRGDGKMLANLLWTLALLSPVLAGDLIYKAHRVQRRNTVDMPAPGRLVPRQSPPLVVGIMLDGSELTSSFLDEEGWPREELLPNLRRILRQDFHWFPRSVSVSPATYSTLPSFLTGEPVYKKANRRANAGWDMFSLVAREWPIRGFFYKHYYRGFCQTHVDSCALTKEAEETSPYTAVAALLWSRIKGERPGIDPAFVPRQEHFSFDIFLNSVARARPGEFHYIHIFRRNFLLLKEFDEQFARLERTLERAGLYEDAVVFLVSDHGLDHTSPTFPYGHQADPGPRVYRIPLAVKPRGRGKGEVSTFPAQQTDLFPTILGLYFDQASVQKLGVVGVDLLRLETFPARRKYHFNCNGKEGRLVVSENPEAYRQCRR